MTLKPIKNRWIIPIGLLTACVFLFFVKVLISGNSLFGGDVVLYFHPLKTFIRDYILTQKNIPLWNPYLFSGTPIISNLQGSMFYPLGFLYYLLPAETAYLYTTIGHCILGAVFMYAFMRSLSISCGGSFIAALVFTFNGFFMGHLYAGHLTFVQTYIWIPIIFRYLHEYLTKRYIKSALMSGLLLGIQILGGFPQIAFYTILGILSFGVFYTLFYDKERQLGKSIKLCIGMLVIVIVGFALASVQVLPSLEFSMHSTRAGGVSYEFATDDSLHPKDLLAFLIPNFFGNAVDETYWGGAGIWHFWESCGYVGILPLFLVFIRADNRKGHFLRYSFLLLIILSLFLSLGKYNPFYPLIYKLPGFHNFRIPAQTIFLYVFAMSVVSGLGFHQMQRAEWRINKQLWMFMLIIGLILFLLLAGLTSFQNRLLHFFFEYLTEVSIHKVDLREIGEIAGKAIYMSFLFFLGSFIFILSRSKIRGNTTLFNILIPGFLILDLYLFGTHFIRAYDYRWSLLSKEKIVSHLSKSPVQGRVLTMSDLLHTNDALQYKFPSILGYDPLILKRYVAYVLWSESEQDHQYDRMVHLGRVNKPTQKMIKILNARQLILNDKKIIIENNIPYANFVNKTVIKPQNEILRFIKSEEFDPREVVVLEQRDRRKYVLMNENKAPEASIRILSYDNENIRFKASTKGPAYLVLSEIYYPGWRAKVNGQDVEVLCGNYIFRVILLPKGDHEIHMFFTSSTFHFGTLITLLTLVGALYLIRRSG